MTAYMHCDITHVRKGEWLGYCNELDLMFHASSEEKLRCEGFRLIEESQGLHAFSIIWTER